MTSYDLKRIKQSTRKNKDKRNYELTVYEIEYYKNFLFPLVHFSFLYLHFL